MASIWLLRKSYGNITYVIWEYDRLFWGNKPMFLFEIFILFEIGDNLKVALKNILLI